jgi:hypothetical protein
MSGIFLSSSDYAAVQRVLLAGSRKYGSASVERLNHAFAASAGLAPAITPKCPEQRPDLMIPGLTEQPWYEPSDFSFCCEVEGAALIVRAEAENIVRSSQALQPVQRDHYVPTGRWDAIFIRVGSTWVEENRRLCPQAFRLTESIPRLSQLSMISVLSGGGHIAPHWGRWNCRLTLHVGLSIPENCGLRVGGETRTWEPGKLLIFDDTFEHEAWNRSDKPRCVLLFDVWHPDLSRVEVEMLEQLREEAGIHDGMATLVRRKEEPRNSHRSRSSGSGSFVSSARIGGVSLDWSRLAEPQPDQYDTNVMLWLVSAMRGGASQQPYKRPPVADSPAVFDGSVAIRYVYRSLPGFETLAEQYPDGPTDHPNIGIAAEYVRSWPAAFQQCQRLLEAIHPATDRTMPLISSEIYRGAVSCSVESLFGTMWSTIFCPFGLAEATIREVASQKLRVLGAVLQFPASTMAALHAHYSNVHVTALDLHLVQALGDSSVREVLARVLEKNVTIIEEGNANLGRELCPGNAGSEFIESILDWTAKTIQLANAFLAGDMNQQKAAPTHTAIRPVGWAAFSNRVGVI